MAGLRRLTHVAGIVLAAGSGSRFGNPKQFEELSAGVRLVDQALRVASEACAYLVLVLPEECEWDGQAVDAVVAGGATRLDSVAAGLSAVPAEFEVVVVHDAAHPLAPVELFEAVTGAVSAGAEAAVPLLAVSDVVKAIDVNGTVRTVGREGLGLAQVPMAFSAATLRRAHASRDRSDASVWEDAMLVESSGGRVVAVPGSAGNLHVVDEADLRMVRLLVAGASRERGNPDH